MPIPVSPFIWKTNNKMFFSKKEKKGTPVEGIINSLVSLPCGTMVAGDIQTKCNIRIEGDVKGKIMTSGRLVISDSGRVDGNIKCSSALISGYVKGNIVSEGLVVLKVPAKIMGNILATDINIEPGVVVNGLYRIIESGIGAEKAAPAEEDRQQP